MGNEEKRKGKCISVVVTLLGRELYYEATSSIASHGRDRGILPPLRFPNLYVFIRNATK